MVNSVAWERLRRKKRKERRIKGRPREREVAGELEREFLSSQSARCLPAVTFKRCSKYKTLARIKETNSWRAQYELNMLINN